jgi:hypothetical protein
MMEKLLSIGMLAGWIVLLTLQGPKEVFAQSQKEILVSALEAQDKGDDPRAIELYEKVIKDGLVNGHLFYNLGISYFKAQKIGEAMAAFLAARRYLPRDPDVRANLKFVQSKIVDKLEPSLTTSIGKKLSVFVDWFTKKELIIACFVMLMLVSGATFIGLVVDRVGILGRYGWYGFILPIVMGGLVLAKELQDPRWGAIKFQDGAKVYSGPGETHTLLYTLQVGAPVFLTGAERQNYLPIEISDGKKGWVLAAQVAYFGEGK